MPSFQRCPEEVQEMAESLLQEFPEHRPLVNAGVRIDLVFAHAFRDERTGEPLEPALKLRGRRVYGLARKIPPKQRALGRGDAEISLDGDWWADATEEEQRALLDHELHHLAVKMKDSTVALDQQGRPRLSLREHDVEIGWFNVIAHRHGRASIERSQAAAIMEQCGQFYWPEIMGALGRTQQDVTKATQQHLKRLVNARDVTISAPE